MQPDEAMQIFILDIWAVGGVSNSPSNTVAIMFSSSRNGPSAKSLVLTMRSQEDTLTLSRHKLCRLLIVFSGTLTCDVCYFPGLKESLSFNGIPCGQGSRFPFHHTLSSHSDDIPYGVWVRDHVKWLQMISGTRQLLPGSLLEPLPVLSDRRDP